MVHQEVLDILRCAYCAPHGKEGMLDVVRETWLVCQECGRTYPIRDDIPVMLLDVGEKWMATSRDALPVPPPEEG